MVLGIGAIGAGFWLDLVPLLLGGAGLLASTIPASLALDNDSPTGKWVFGGMLVGIYLVTILVVVVESYRVGADQLHTLTTSLGLLALVGAFACTWLGNIRTLRQELRT